MIKTLFCILFSLALLAATASSALAGPPKLLRLDRVFLNNNPGLPAVALVFEKNGTADAIEVQRKLRFGWHRIAIINGSNSAWTDITPANRPTWYRIRILSGKNVSEWSNKAWAAGP